MFAKLEIASVDTHKGILPRSAVSKDRPLVVGRNLR